MKKTYQMTLTDATVTFQIDLSQSEQIIEASTFWADAPPKEAALQEHVKNVLQVAANQLYCAMMAQEVWSVRMANDFLRKQEGLLDIAVVTDYDIDIPESPEWEINES